MGKIIIQVDKDKNIIDITCPECEAKITNVTNVPLHHLLMPGIFQTKPLLCPSCSWNESLNIVDGGFYVTEVDT